MLLLTHTTAFAIHIPSTSSRDANDPLPPLHHLSTRRDPGRRFYRSGDLATWSSGSTASPALVFAGRRLTLKKVRHGDGEVRHGED